MTRFSTVSLPASWMDFGMDYLLILEAAPSSAPFASTTLKHESRLDGGASEWPALLALLPDLQGRKVLDLGCGYGWFCRWVREKGAADILGIDVSEKMLARAAATTQDKAIRYERADMEQLELPAAAFDLVYSSLALHYVKELERLMAQVHRSLAPGGSLVFSAEHPIYTAPTAPGWVQ